MAEPERLGAVLGALGWAHAVLFGGFLGPETEPPVYVSWVQLSETARPLLRLLRDTDSSLPGDSAAAVILYGQCCVPAVTSLGLQC